MYLNKINEIIAYIQAEIPYFTDVRFAGYRQVLDNALVTFIDGNPVNLNERICYLRHDGTIQYGQPSARLKSCKSLQAEVPIKLIAQLDCANTAELEALMIYKLLSLTTKGEMQILSSSTDVRAIFESETGEQYQGNDLVLVSIDLRINAIFDNCSDFDPCANCC